MGVVFKTGLLLALVVIADVLLDARRQEAHPIRDQILFSEEEPLLHAVPLTPDVLNILLKTKQAKQGLEFANASQRDNPARLFRAGEVHLSRSDEIDLVVIGVPPMRGADNRWL